MDFGTTGSVVKDVAIIMVVVPTCVMNMYIWVTLRALRHENDALYKAAITALFLFLNFFLCYAYFTTCYVFYIYTVVTGRAISIRLLKSFMIVLDTYTAIEMV